MATGLDRTPMMHTIPSEWIAEAQMQDFKASTPAFRCDMAHTLIALSDIEPPLRNEGVILDANGFRHNRMVRILVGLRVGDALPPIDVEIADLGRLPYRLRGGVHRYYASRTFGFTHIPVDIVPRLS
jgi:hypothetical protein